MRSLKEGGRDFIPSPFFLEKIMEMTNDMAQALYYGFCGIVCAWAFLQGFKP